MNPLHTLFPFKGFQYTPASISLHRESDRNLSTTLIHEKIIQKNIFSFYSFSDPGSTYFLGLLCLSLKEVRGPDSMKCMHVISRDGDHSEGWGAPRFGGRTISFLVKGAGSFHIHRKTMKELCILAVLGIREQPNLAQNLVTHRH